MNLWYCVDCAISYAPDPYCPLCNKFGEWMKVDWLKDELDDQVDSDLSDTRDDISKC